MSPHIHSKLLDYAAAVAGPAAVALASFHAIENALKILVLILTLLFLALGIAMRVMKIRKASIEEEEED